MNFIEEYNNFKVSEDKKFYKEHYFLASKGAISLYPSVINFKVLDPPLYQEIMRKINAMDYEICKKQWAERKRIEQQEEKEKGQMREFLEEDHEIDISKIPFSFILVTIVSILA